MSFEEELEALGLEDFFLHYLLEGKRLLSGNAWGTRMGRSFSFDLETHRFFDYGNVKHSGVGVKQLFELRGEKLPEKYRLNYTRFEKKKGAARRVEKTKKAVSKIYIKGPLEVVPPQMTPPSHLTFWNQETEEKIVLPARVYTYRNLLGQTVGFLLKAREGQNEVVRPLSVWERLVGHGEKTIFSYRQKAFEPYLYRAEGFLAEPESPVFVLENEELVDHFYKKKHGLPMLFTTWPFGPKSILLNKSIWEVLEKRRVFLLPSPNDESIKEFSLLRKAHLPEATLFNPLQLGVPKSLDLRDFFDSFESLRDLKKMAV